MDKFEYHSPYSTYYNCYFRKAVYQYGHRLAISIWNDTVGPIADVTVNIDYPLKSDQIAVKDYSENEGMLNEMLRIGLIKKVVDWHLSGFVRIPICEFDAEVLERYVGS